MYIKILIFELFCWLGISPVFGQDKTEIQSSPLYYYGEGIGETFDEAYQDALAQMIRQISVSVYNGYSQTIDNDIVKIHAKIRSYSYASLQNVNQIVISEENPAKIFCYIKKEEVSKSFDARRERALSFIDDANKASETARIGDAIKYYYWAMVLLNTIPNGATIKAPLDNGEETLVYTWCHDRICRIIDDLTVDVSDIQQYPTYSTVLLDVKYKGIPVADLDFQYWIGQRFSALYSVKDGQGTADFEHLANGDQIKFKIEYQYSHIARNLDSELRGCFETDIPTFPLSRIQKFATVHIDENESVEMTEPTRKTKKREKVIESVPFTQPNLRVSAYARNQDEAYRSVDFSAPQDESPYLEIMQRIESAIRQKDYESVMTLFTSDGYDMFNKLVAYGKASIVAAPHYDFIKFGDEVICRSIPMQFRFRNNKVFVEEVTFRFDKDKRIDSIAFTLSDSIEALLFDAGFRWDNNSRLLMMEFMENYQTAYSLKRSDYIESVFSDDALIIVGKVLKTGTARRTDTPLFNDPQVELARYTKAEYIRHLRSSFASKEYINIGFEDIDIAKMTKGGEIYAIHIKQYYHSNNYADTGYLTLLVDMRDSAKPMIHVRVWNPKKDPNFTALKFLQHGATLLD